MRAAGFEPAIRNHPARMRKIWDFLTVLVALTDLVLLVLLLAMASLRKRPGSKLWVCCYTRPDGSRAQRSTGKVKRDDAMEICLKWEASADQARQGNFTEAQARKVVSDIAQRSGMTYHRNSSYFADSPITEEKTASPGRLMWSGQSSSLILQIASEDNSWFSPKKASP